MNSPDDSQLGKPAAYRDTYDPTLLFPISRAPKREELGLAGALPFFGADLWTALAWCAGILVVGYLFATVTHRRWLSS